MKLVRFEREGHRLGVVQGDTVIDLTGNGLDDWTMLQVIAAGQGALERIRKIVARAPASLALSALRLLPPIERPGKYLAIGMNYGKHVDEANQLGIARSRHQVWFNKQTSCLTGPFDSIEPGVTQKLDYEVELGVVIGKPARYVSETDAYRHVFGYFVANDVSARDWQFHSQTFTVGKSFDTHGPIGPWIVTADEIRDPHALNLRCYVNGELRQNSSTGQMLASIWSQIAYLSTAFTLDSGDLLATGTPEGVGVALNPPRFLQPGDKVRCEIDGIGAIENVIGLSRPTPPAETQR